MPDYSALARAMATEGALGAGYGAAGGGIVAGVPGIVAAAPRGFATGAAAALARHLMPNHQGAADLIVNGLALPFPVNMLPLFGAAATMMGAKPIDLPYGGDADSSGSAGR